MFSKTYISMHTNGDIGVHTQTCKEVYTQDKHVHTGEFSQIYIAVHTHTGIYTSMRADTYRFIFRHTETQVCVYAGNCTQRHTSMHA